MSETEQPSAPSPPPPGQPVGVPSNLVWGILVTLFCCMPMGVVSIVYAAQVDTKVAAGDIAGALLAAANAKKWAMIGAGCGAVLYLLFFVLATVGVGFRAATG